MKSKVKTVLGLFLTVVCSCAIFVGLAFVTLSDFSLNSSTVNKYETSQPYSPPAPDNMAVMFLWEEGGGEIVYLDFENTETVVTILPKGSDENAALVYGYREFETVRANYMLIGGIIDRLGGIELEWPRQSKEVMRYTGSQIASMLGKYYEDWEFKRAVIGCIFEKISVLGFSNSDFMFIINNGSTTLSFPDCYGLETYMQSLCKNFKIIN